MSAQTETPLIASLVRTGVEPVVGYRPGASELTAERSARLDWNESPFGLSPKAQAVLTSFTLGNRYPDFRQTALREALGAYVGVHADRIVPGSGLDDVFETLALLLIEPGDEVIISEPTFGVYRSLFSMHGAKIVNVPLTPAPDFRLDVDGILAAVTPKTKLVMLCQPNNPTGNLMPKEDIERIVANVPAYVGIDEAYAEFSGANHLDLANSHENVVIFRTLSKFAGLAGFRVGYGVFPESAVPYLNRVSPPFFNITTLSAQIAIASLDDLDHLNANLQVLLAEREQLAANLAEIDGVEVYPSATNFILASLPVESSEGLLKDLAARNVYVRRFPNPDHHLGHCLRISIGSPEDNRMFLETFTELLDHHRAGS
ncbi:MAG TPA: histidinol-phosphate transaminase [Thermomicrobiales bacterium]|nr:histidinol-phosphate transaminase [Thermomicrobiales bacterium]